MTDCLRCHSGTPCRGSIPAFGDPCTTVIPAKAGIQGWGYEIGNLRLSTTSASHKGRYAKISVRGNDGGGGFGPRWPGCRDSTSVLLSPHDDRARRPNLSLSTIEHRCPTMSHFVPPCSTSDTNRGTPSVPFPGKVSHRPDSNGTLWNTMGQFSRKSTAPLRTSTLRRVSNAWMRSACPTRPRPPTTASACYNRPHP